MTDAPVRSRSRLLIGTFDLSGFLREVRGFDDERIAAALDTLYLLVDTAVSETGGRIVKYLGDGALVVWPPDRADDVVARTLDLRAQVAESLRAVGLRVELKVTLHCAEVLAGEFAADRHYDIIGQDVFTVFRLPVRTMSLSAEAFRCLSPEVRTLLKKHTEPVVYIPTGDPRP